MKLGTHRNGPASCRIRKATALPVHMQGRVFELVDLWCRPRTQRRKGYARELLTAIGTAADIDDAFLMLQVADGETRDMLCRMYAEHGFGIIQAGPPILMVRPPIRVRLAMTSADPASCDMRVETRGDRA